MKKIFFILFWLGSLSLCFSQTNEDPILFDVDVMPTWEGCDQVKDTVRNICFEKRLGDFFNDFIIYPERAKRKKVEGQVIVQFVIEKDGSVSNIKILHDIGEGCADEVVRAIQHLPKLIPGQDNGTVVRVIYKASFNFMLK